MPLILAPLSNHTPPRLLYGSVDYPNPQLTAVLEIRIKTDLILSQIEPAQFVSVFGPAQFHREQFKSTISWTAEDGTTNSRVIYIDHDHYYGVC